MTNWSVRSSFSPGSEHFTFLHPHVEWVQAICCFLFFSASAGRWYLNKQVSVCVWKRMVFTIFWSGYHWAPGVLYWHHPTCLIWSVLAVPGWMNNLTLTHVGEDGPWSLTSRFVLTARAQSKCCTAPAQHGNESLYTGICSICYKGLELFCLLCWPVVVHGQIHPWNLDWILRNVLSIALTVDHMMTCICSLHSLHHFSWNASCSLF